jgi:hypothetical protein
MKVYHGSLVVVEKPEIRVGDRYLDFGYGFYTTMNEEQAIKWTEKQKNRKGINIGYVSMYDFDIEKAEAELKIIRFDKADKEWLDFVSVNRKGQCQETYDIVVGPVADDGVYEVVRFYEIGVYDLEETLKRLKVEELYNQVLFHTEKSLTYLRFIGTEEK